MSGISTIILTENNLSQSGTFDSATQLGPYNRLSLPVNTDLTNYEVCLNRANLYYSWPNVSASNNQAMTIQWPVGAGFNTYNFNLDLGNYESIDALNNALQQFCILNGLYLINGIQNVYYIQLAANPSRYGVDLTLFKIPTSLPGGFTAPGSWPGYPSTNITPKVQFKAGFNKLIGFNTSTVFDGGLTQTTFNSSFSPQLSPTSSILMTLNIANNQLSLNNSNSVISVFTTKDTAFGSILQIEPNSEIWFDVNARSCSNIVVEFYDQDYNRLNIQDPQITVMLLLRKKK